MTTHELLQMIRQCPTMYLGRPSADNLHAFLKGFEFARKDSDPDVFRFLSEFGNWVHNRYNIHSSQAWSKIIEFYSLTEADEMALFWRLLDEFESRPKRKPRQAKPARPEAART